MFRMEARVVDSTHLELLKPIDTPTGSKVLVAVAEAEDDQGDRELWLAVSAERLLEAYGEDEPEYTLDMVKKPNPEFIG